MPEIDKFASPIEALPHAFETFRGFIVLIGRAEKIGRPSERLFKAVSCNGLEGRIYERESKFCVRQENYVRGGIDSRQESLNMRLHAPAAARVFNREQEMIVVKGQEPEVNQVAQLSFAVQGDRTDRPLSFPSLHEPPFELDSSDARQEIKY